MYEGGITLDTPLSTHGEVVPAFARSALSVAQGLGTDDTKGLSAKVAAARLVKHGPNTIKSEPPISQWRRLVAQFADPVVLLLLVAIVISALVWLAEGGHGFPLDPAVIAVIVVANAGLGFIQVSLTTS